jgi:hypothetical protein
MAFNDPSNPVSKALEWAGGGWGAVLVVVGAAIGGLIGLAQPVTGKSSTCLRWEDTDGTISGMRCAEYAADLMGWINTGSGGVALGAIVGAAVWLGMRELRKQMAPKA